ncbi:hypothetical protein AAE478_002171 [Parahypoxylon ruwenzoriense]
MSGQQPTQSNQPAEDSTIPRKSALDVNLLDLACSQEKHKPSSAEAKAAGPCPKPEDDASRHARSVDVSGKEDSGWDSEGYFHNSNYTFDSKK